MRILHTSDWHIGKKLQSKSRLSEQAAALDELYYVCKNDKIDLVLVAGDIFDTSSPSPEAEELFYASTLNIARHCPIVAIAGNHDDPNRLSAPRGIASTSNIFLVGGLDNSSLASPSKSVQGSGYTRLVEGGKGWLRFVVGEQPLNLALLPYPSLSRIAELREMEGDDFQQRVASLIARCTDGFVEGEANIFCSHLYISGSEAIDNELGGAAMLPSTVLPSDCYNALGHIHKPQVASRSKNAHYSGSLLAYSFDDTSKKRFVVVDYDKKGVSYRDIPITSQKTPIRVSASSVAEAISILQGSADKYVELTYCGSEPLRPSDVNSLRSFDCFCKLCIQTPTVQKSSISRQNRSMSQLFADFYTQSYGTPPDPANIELFIKVIEGEDVI